jgi:hypothetical protein
MEVEGVEAGGVAVALNGVSMDAAAGARVSIDDSVSSVGGAAPAMCPAR